jgi:ABC-2 type transport system permease protein
MSARITVAMARRVLWPIRRDRRTLALLLLPQLLLCRLFVDRDDMAGLLHAASWALPFTYAHDALARATRPAPLGGGIAVDVAVIAAATIGALALGALTLRRRTG